MRQVLTGTFAEGWCMVFFLGKGKYGIEVEYANEARVASADGTSLS